jgi:hypothetical protein
VIIGPPAVRIFLTVRIILTNVKTAPMNCGRERAWMPLAN